MIRKIKFGNPFETEAVVENFECENECDSVKELVGSLITTNTSGDNGFCFKYEMTDTDVIYGLGEANRGINKRGYVYESFCTDDPNHSEDKISLYGAHNFIIVSDTDRKVYVGLFFDYPTKIRFDIGYTVSNQLVVSCERPDLYLYVISGDSAYDVTKQFRRIIGRSYIPPKFAFGFGQSRWGYKTQEDFEEVVRRYRENNIPLDMIYLDIDYMERYKDFTTSKDSFPDFKKFIDGLKANHVHAVPIIDAGVKIEEGYDIYEEGRDKGYFCKREDDSDFVAAVWPGWTHFPDVLNPEAREWFGEKYKILTDMGIDGFWNDMNEPAIFYSEEGIAALNKAINEYVAGKDEDAGEDIINTAKAVPSAIKNRMYSLQNNEEDYKRFYHNVNGKKVRHDLVHNLYGYNMTRAAGEAFSKIVPDKRILLFSRSSYIGMHRYGGIWTGDNKSWWSHILLNIKMMPSLNMCGFLYTGADLGGFGDNTTRDLLLRWLALGVFTPLMRNHAALGTRQQECYRFEKPEDFRHVIGVRYRLIPYLYSEYMKAALGDDMYFKPLGFVYPEDKMAIQVEDQLMLGNEIMIAPVYTQNATGRYVYLPEEMKLIKFIPGKELYEEVLSKGHHYIDVALNEVVMFIRKYRCIPLAKAGAQSVDEIDWEDLEYIGYCDSEYELYFDNDEVI